MQAWGGPLFAEVAFFRRAMCLRDLYEAVSFFFPPTAVLAVESDLMLFLLLVFGTAVTVLLACSQGEGGWCMS